jgi:PAS domain S-box-containing protein
MRGGEEARVPPESRTHGQGSRLAAQNQEVTLARRLIESEHSRYRALFELAPDAYLVTDPEGNILEANDAAEALLGVSRRSLIGKAVAGFTPAEGRKSFRRKFLKLAETRGVFETEARFASRARVFDVGISIAPIRKDGMLEGFGCIVRDITARKQAESELETLTVELERRVSERTQELDEERARLQAVVEQLPTGLVITNAGGQTAFMNRPAEELLAHLRRTDEAGFPGGFPAFRLNGEPYPEVERPSMRALNVGETTSAERLYFERVDGSRVLFEVSAAPIRDSHQRITAAAVTLRDLSDREGQERSEREFVANASHELRTPIAALLGAIEVLQAGAKEMPEERDLFLGHIEREAGRLGRLAHALLVLARAQAGARSIKLELVRLSPLLTDVAQVLVAHEDVEITVDCPSDLRVWSDHDLLEQAITSLAINAVTHTRQGRVVLAAHTNDSGLAIEVRDTGDGIKRRERRRIFERFYRPKGANRDGFGLGLAIVRQAADALGSQIEVESKVGVGTTVRLRLPAKLLA